MQTILALWDSGVAPQISGPALLFGIAYLVLFVWLGFRVTADPKPKKVR